MSLINEALKRTREQSASAGYAVAATPPADYRVATPARPGRRRASVWRGGTVVGLVLLAGAIAWGFHLVRIPSTPAVPVASAALLTGQVSVPPSKPVPEALPAPKPEVAAAALVPAEPIPVPATAAPEPSPLPALQLQGVSRFNGVYEAMINGFTLRVGEEVEGARVVVIEPRLVRLTYRGETVELRLR